MNCPGCNTEVDIDCKIVDGQAVYWWYCVSCSRGDVTSKPEVEGHA